MSLPSLVFILKITWIKYLYYVDVGAWKNIIDGPLGMISRRSSDLSFLANHPSFPSFLISLLKSANILPRLRKITPLPKKVCLMNR